MVEQLAVRIEDSVAAFARKRGIGVILLHVSAQSVAASILTTAHPTWKVHVLSANEVCRWCSLEISNRTRCTPSRRLRVET
jgi:hypothetical protein